MFLSGGRGGRTSSCLIPDKTAGNEMDNDTVNTELQEIYNGGKRKGNSLKRLFVKC